MKTFACVVVAVFVALMVATCFVPPPAYVIEEARRYFDDDVITRGREHALGGRLLFWGATLLQLGALFVLVGPLGRRLVARCEHIAPGRWLPTLLLLAAVCFVLFTVLQLPFDVGRWAHQTAWGMTERPLGDWFAEYALARAVNAVIEGVALVGLYVLMRWLPRGWWLGAAAGLVVLAVLIALVLPVFISPLFNTFTPIRQTKWADWEPRLHALVAKAEAKVGDVLVMDASSQSRHSNAYFTGFGATRRIVLYDNLLEKHELPEVESILAHELGHWLHDHIVKGIALGGLAGLAGFYLLARLLRRLEVPLGWRGPSDPATLPVILLAAFLASWVVMPVGNLVSRHFERQADQMALELARQPEVFIAAEKKLTIDNLGNVAPTPWNVWLFSTHPPAVERIEMARQWRKDNP